MVVDIAPNQRIAERTIVRGVKDVLVPESVGAPRWHDKRTAPFLGPDPDEKQKVAVLIDRHVDVDPVELSGTPCESDEGTKIQI